MTPEFSEDCAEAQRQAGSARGCTAGWGSFSASPGSAPSVLSHLILARSSLLRGGVRSPRSAGHGCDPEAQAHRPRA